MRHVRVPLAFKRFRWVATGIGLVGIMGLIASGIFTRVRPNPDGKPPVVSSKELKTGSAWLNIRLPWNDLAANEVRESKHHAAGEFQKIRRTLEQRIADQKLVCEEKRAALEDIIRANHKDIIDPISQRSQLTREEAAMSILGDENYVNAKMEFETEQTILHAMKIRLVAETIRKQ